MVAACGGGSGGAVDGGGTGGDAGSQCPTPCEPDEVCRYMTCVPTPAPCSTTDDCGGDFYCDLPAGECLPWGVGPGGTSDDTCTREVVAGVFFPDAQCEWLGPPAGDPYPDHKNILAAPVVADFGVSGDPELRRPSIVFTSYNFTDGGSQACAGSDPAYTGIIRVIDGRSCEQQASITTPVPIASASLALADLTGDGVPEIIAPIVGGGMAAWQRQLDGSFAHLWTTDVASFAGSCVWTGPSVHDLDDDGVPEVLFYGAVFDASGTYLSDVGALSPTSTGYIPVAADVDADGQVELVGGATLFGWDTATNAWVAEANLGPGQAHTAVADFGTFGADPGADDRATLDGIAEVARVQTGAVSIYTIGGRLLFGPITLPGGGNGGAPTIADFDGDGRVELASAGAAAYTVFDPDCGAAAEPATCPTLATNGVLWSQPSQDGSSNVTGSSVFDFEGDGLAEAVYGDECFTRVYDGSSGTVVYSRFRTSCTWYENPVIADTDADFGAEIIITSNTNCGISCPAVDPIFDGINCFDESDCPGATSCVRDDAGDALGKCRCELDEDCGGDGFVCLDPIAGASAAGKVCRAAHPGPSTAFGLRVVGDQLDRWVATRGIWNQHAYAVTNVEDNGQVPRTSEWMRNWQVPGLNNFRQNSPGDGAGAGLMPDLTARNGGFQCTGSGVAELSVEVCNRGTDIVGDGLDAVFVTPGDAVACTGTTALPLRPGFCQTVRCDWTGAPTGDAVGIKVSVDEAGAHTECRELNNSALITGVVCP